ITKTEPSHSFNIREGDRFWQHVIARRLSAMEVMFLTLGEKICHSSIKVQYLPTDIPESQSKAILPVNLLINNPDDPYYKDSLDKYFNRPAGEMFETLTYEQYFRLYDIKSPGPNVPRLVGYDQFGNRILRRTKPIIIRIRPLCINNNDSYFYQLLLKHRNWRSDAEIRGSYDNYRDRYLALFPDALRQIQHENSAYIERTRFEFNQQFAVALDSILHRLSNELSIRNIDILRMQLLSLQPAPYIMPCSLTLNLPSDQYYVMNTLTHWMGSMSNDKYPYFFVTGSAGTGKTYIIRLLCQFLSTRRSKYLLMAPTGVAAQNIGGKTIHSELRITSSQSGFQTLVHHDVDL